jgi:hypothetical protein
MLDIMHQMLALFDAPDLVDVLSDMTAFQPGPEIRLDRFLRDVGMRGAWGGSEAVDRSLGWYEEVVVGVDQDVRDGGQAG